MPAPDGLSVQVDGLTEVYGSGNTEVVAVRNASFTVARGEVVALLGPSGSGKSTMLSAIGLINPPAAVRIAINDRPVMEGPRALVELRALRRHHLCLVFQKANLIPFLAAWHTSSAPA